jgi:hypothetical protein
VVSTSPSATRAAAVPSLFAPVHCTERWYRHGLVRGILFTDGAKHVADRGGAYWLIDEIAFAQKGEPKVAAEEFQLWRLTVRPDHTATARCKGLPPETTDKIA